MSDVLLVAATERELQGLPGLVCGVGPVDAAVATARALARDVPLGVVHVGIAGGRGLALGAVVIGAEAVYVDLQTRWPVERSIAAEGAMVAAARVALPGATVEPIATTAAVGRLVDAGHDLPRVEAMEGFGVLRACAAAGVPALELRSISNEIGEEDRSRWDIEGALAALATAIPLVVAGVTQALREPRS